MASHAHTAAAAALASAARSDAATKGKNKKGHERNGAEWCVARGEAHLDGPAAAPLAVSPLVYAGRAGCIARRRGGGCGSAAVLKLRPRGQH